ncbi:hypothetical protein UCD39_01430 [Nitrospirillum sp. BR 11752]|uniref:hypothetical protein n=1 Tax=Nitrospirillum sp. BR 11752 TaxID=3104293 RepID=UPI002EC7587D|nr:hypothetical protein [Nitrospirillum sp. BR 11752]
MARPVAATALALVLPGLAGCSGGVLDPQGPVAAQELTILLDSLGIMLAIVLPTILATLGVAWWFRAGNARARYRPDWEYSGRIEMVVWSIPAMTVLLLGGIGWVSSRDLDPPRPLAAAGRAVPVQVVSLNWKWLFIYPEQGIASVNHLVVPAGTPISFQLTSDGVMNSFFVPQLGSQNLRHARHDHATEPAGGQARPLSRNLRPVQWRRLPRHAVHGGGRAARRLRPVDRHRPGPRRRAG